MSYAYLLADVTQRIEAKFIDCMLFACAFAPGAFVIRKGAKFDFTPESCSQEEKILALVSAALLAVFFAAQTVCLLRSSQTIGKRFVGIRVVRRNGHRAGVIRVFWIREVLFWFIAILPGIGQLFLLVDLLFLFRDDRRCLHDWMAGTVVRQTWD